MAVATAESETLVMTLRVPVVVANHIRQQVSTGVYKDGNEYVESLLLSDTLFEELPDNELVNWMNTEGVRRLKALEADPSSALTIDEVFAGLIDDDEDA